MTRLSGKSAVVTGAGKGIGLGIARRFAAEGARVLLVDIDRDALAGAASELGQPSLCIDVSDKAQVEQLIAEAIAAFGSLDVLVNNAAIAPLGATLDVDEASFDKVMAVNLKSVLFGIQAAAPHMIARGSGSIINIASVAAKIATPGAVAYCVSKAAVVQLTNAAAIELAPMGVRVNAIGPGTIETEMSASVYDSPQKRAVNLSRIPMGRPGNVDEIAGVAVFLATDDASYVTGKTLYVDGGKLGLSKSLDVNVA
ncbi:MAG: SDR family oxidoreductase [Porticoccaceae bacterium]